MNKQLIADKIVALRKSKGLSQEELAEKASINLRTLQRIESGTSLPRGYTLRLIARELGHPLTEFSSVLLKEDRSFLHLLNLSALGLWIMPFGNLIFPLTLWLAKRDIIQDVYEFGIRIINFQIAWSLITYCLLLTAISGATLHPVWMNPLAPFFIMMAVLGSFLVNTIVIVRTSFLLQKNPGNIGTLKLPFIKIISIRTAIAGLVFLFCGGMISATNAQSIPSTPLRKQFPPPGKLIDIGGWKLHLYGQGDSHQGPSVILEAGAGDFSFDWSFVQPQISAFAGVYSYDRAGSAWSELGPRPHTMHQTVYELHTLLHTAQVPQPYLLVGASYGALLVRMFALQYPSEVAGVVLVDGGDEDSELFINGNRVRASTYHADRIIPPVKMNATEEDNQLAQTQEAQKLIGDALKNAGYPNKKIVPPYTLLPDSIQRIRLAALSQFEHYAANDNDFYIDELAQLFRQRKSQPQMLGNIPLIVLTRGRPDGPEDSAREQERIRAQAALPLLSANSKQIIVTESGHHIQLEAPVAVVEAVREVFQSVKTKSKLSP